MKKKYFAPGNRGGTGVPPAPPPFPTALYYGEGLMTQQGKYYFSMNYIEIGENMFSLKQV